jgi:double-strand break repair protein MRE11
VRSVIIKYIRRRMENHKNEDNNINDDNVPNKDEDEDSILRIMVTTDNHLGFEIHDKVRGNDSFETMEEIFKSARRHKCDMILFGGDLFHDNKPCPRTMFRTQSLFRKYCLGDNPVRIRLLSDPSLNFTSAPEGGINYEDPHLSIDVSYDFFLL